MRPPPPATSTPAPGAPTPQCWTRRNASSCLLCVPFCPDSSLPVQDGKLVGIDYHHCKGCGICATGLSLRGDHLVKEGGQP